MTGKVNRTEVEFFSAANWKDAKAQCDLWVRAQCAFAKSEPGSSQIAIYFDEDADVYKVTTIQLGMPSEREVYSWDEISQLIHENI